MTPAPSAGGSRLVHLTALISTALFLLLMLFDPAVPREHLEAKTYDLRLYVRSLLSVEEPREDVLIVAVDEQSIREVGRWPWRRLEVARLLQGISTGEPRAVGMDILFSEPEDEASDAALEAALARTGNVVLAAGFIVDAGSVPPSDRPPPAYLWDHAFMEVRSTKDVDWKRWAVTAADVVAPLERFARHASVGSVYSLPDRDGVLRWEFLSLGHADDYYPSFALQTARVALGLPPEEMALVAGSGVRLGERLIPTDLSGRTLIDYRGSEGTFRYIPAVDVLRGQVPADTFRDRVVLVGTSAVATYDLKVTPLSANLPGVEKNASVVADILEGGFIVRSPGALEMAATLLSALLLSMILGRVRAVGGAAAALLLIAAYVFIAFFLFVNRGLWVTLTYPVMNLLVIYVGTSTARYFVEERQARRVRRMFSSYVSPRVVETLIAHPEKARLGGERRELTMLFSDIAGFTGISEKLPPEEVVSLLNEFFRAMTDVIFRWEGTFDKIVGDEIVAFWGAPVDQPDHAELAVRCALDMRKTLSRLHERWRREGKPLLDCGVGINTGEVVVGNIGAEGKKMDYTAIGDHVNAAARVEALTRHFGSGILLTEFTARKIMPLLESKSIGHAAVVFRDTVTVKGKQVQLGIYELKDLHPADHRNLHADEQARKRRGS